MLALNLKNLSIEALTAWLIELPFKLNKNSWRYFIQKILHQSKAKSPLWCRGFL